MIDVQQDKMNRRERYIKSLTFDVPDRVWLAPGGPRESTLAAWRQQGLPPGRSHLEVVAEILGLDEPLSAPAGLTHLASFLMIPTFEEKVLAHEDGHYIVQDWMGAITEISDQYDYTYIRSAKDFVTRKWHKFPVQNSADWAAMKWRYDLAHPLRFAADLAAHQAALADRSSPLALHFNGPFWQMREWLGLEGLCMAAVDDPAFIGELAEFWTDFVSGILARLLEVAVPDIVTINEDMAFKAHAMFSPAMTRRFVLPSYQAWVERLRQAGCRICCVDSDGYIGELIPLWLEAGINCTTPIEVAAGNDIVAYRREYGRHLAFIGGIDKRELAKGGIRLHQEVRRVVAPLLEEGGFIPGCDHGVPPDISWPNYIEYARLLAKLLGWL